MEHRIRVRAALGLAALHRLLLVAGLALVTTSTTAVASEPCGTGTYPFPYTDVASVGDPFCPGIMEAYVTGVSKGTTPTTFSPNETVTRVQMTTFLQRSLDQGFARSSRRAALNQWWTQQNTNLIQTVNIGGAPFACAADGGAIWTTNGSGEVIQVQANTGAILGTWTGASSSTGVMTVSGKVFVTGEASPGNLYVLDPTQAPGAVAVAASTLGNDPVAIAYDGAKIWTANTGSVSIITPAATTPYPPGNVTTVTTGFNQPRGLIYDGANIWVTDEAADSLLKLDPSGIILETVAVGSSPRYPAFDGANIWVPNAGDSSITVVQASTGHLVATITADAFNQLNEPTGAAFDGERILITNFNGNTVTVFKAADLSFIANIGSSSNPYAACSDGTSFWVALLFAGNLVRF
jgi:DNA-binding beta-propeller fold protein YncE